VFFAAIVLVSLMEGFQHSNWGEAPILVNALKCCSNSNVWSSEYLPEGIFILQRLSRSWQTFHHFALDEIENRLFRLV
jgi:hypothetical protein